MLELSYYSYYRTLKAYDISCIEESVLSSFIIFGNLKSSRVKVNSPKLHHHQCPIHSKIDSTTCALKLNIFPFPVPPLKPLPSPCLIPTSLQPLHSGGWEVEIWHVPNSGFSSFPDQLCMGENPHPVSGPSSSIHKIATGGIHRIPMSFILAFVPFPFPARWISCFWPSQPTVHSHILLPALAALLLSLFLALPPFITFASVGSRVVRFWPKVKWLTKTKSVLWTF